MVQVDLWLRELDCHDPAHVALASTLGDDEHDRAARYHRAIDRRRYEVRRGLLRTILAGYTGCPARLVAFAETAHGKPHLDAAPPVPAFNLSHSNGVLLLGVSMDGDVGVDIEAVTALLDDIAPVAFTLDECARLAALPEMVRDAYALRLWTCKEAVLKAAGTGLLTPPTSVEITFAGESDWGDVTWLGAVPLHARSISRVYSFFPREGFVAAVAIAGTKLGDAVHFTLRE